MIKIKHSGNAGDIIYSLNAMRSAAVLNNDKVVLFLKLNEPIQLHPAFKHPLGGVMLNEYMFNNLRPLLRECEFIYDVLPYSNQKVDYDFDKFRQVGFNLGAGDIKKWYLYAYPELKEHYRSDDLILNNCVQTWLEQSGHYKKPYIVVNRSERYNNGQIDYSILNQVKLPVYFVGTDFEFQLMKQTLPNLEQKKTKDFLELKNLIYCSDLFIGNQSMCYAIAEQSAANRLLEVYFSCPNVITEGYEMYNQEGFEYVLKQLDLI
jgi:hypothetical protein